MKDRLSIAKIIVFLVSTGVFAPIGDSSASAQCASGSTCATSTHNWTIFGAGNGLSEVIRLGMIYNQGTGKYHPAACTQSSNGSWALWYTYAYSYNTRALTADTAFCAGDGDDVVSMQPYGSTLSCYTETEWISLRGFDSAGWEMKISGGAGNDSISMCNWGTSTPEEAALCGNTGNDILVGCSGADYIHGGTGNDYLDGQGGVDALQGSDDNDVVVHHTGMNDEELMQGGSGNDCFSRSYEYLWDESSSSCGSHSGGLGDRYEDPGDFGSWPPSDCENVATDCCALSGMNCL